MKETMQKKNEWKKMWMSIGCSLLAAFPASTNYQLRDFGIGSGGEGNMTSTNYSMNAITGEISGDKASSANFGLGSGLAFVNQANVPLAPTLSNVVGFYDRLDIIINPSANPSDAVFAVAISDDNFATTKYVQSDNTVGPTLGLEDYRTYAGWGGVSGTTIIGLTDNMTYTVQVKAMQGKFTETGYGPRATASTASVSLAFDIDVAPTDIDNSGPFSIDLGSIFAGLVATSADRVWVDVSTNAALGTYVYVAGSNGGLYSSSLGYQINSSTGDLTTLGEGFGAQGMSATQTSGAALTIASPYDQTGDVVGAMDAAYRQIFYATGSVTGGRGSFVVKAKPSVVAPASGDYAETLTVVAAAGF